MFRAMLQTDMEEARTGRVVVDDIDPDTLELVLGYVYTGQLELGTEADISQLVHAADKYDMPGLKALVYFKVGCSDLKLKAAVIADMLITAELFQSEELEEAVLKRIREDKKLVQDLEFQKKLKDSQKMDLLVDLLLKL